MVDCRNCKHCYRIWADECGLATDQKFKIVCLIKEHFVDWEYARDGPCDEYVDVDSDYTRE